MKDLDDLQEDIGGTSSLQLWILIGACWAAIASGFTSQSGVIFSAVLPHRCAVPPIDNSSLYPDLTEEEILELTIPKDEEGYSTCYRYDYDLDTCTGGEDFSCITDDPGTMKCDNGWHYDRTYYEENTISEWDLVCDRRTLDSIANSLFFFGWFLGSLTFGPLSDWFGRKRAILVYTSVLFFSNLLTAFIPWFPLYVVMRIIVGGGSICSYLSSYTYTIEIMTFQTRMFAAGYIAFINSVTHVILPWTAYAMRDWRYVSLFNALIVVPFFIIYFFIPRSPRWLLVMGKEKEARKFIDACAASNGSRVNDEAWKEVVATERKKIEESGDGGRYKIPDLYRRPMMRMVSLNVLYCWFVVSMVYYGLTLNGGNLAGDPYLNTTLNGVAEVLAHIVFYLTVQFGRSRMLSLTYFGAGLGCLLSMAFDLASDGTEADKALTNTSVAMAIIGKFFASWAFDLVYAVVAEAYPTPVRATGLSMGSMAARIGGMITPFTLQLQYKNTWLTQAIFGSLSLIAAASSLLYPETKDTEFITTLDEAEEFYVNNMPFTRRLLGIKPTNIEKLNEKSNPAFKDDMKVTNETKL